MKTIALVAIEATSVIAFRSALLKTLTTKGFMVYVLASDFDAVTTEKIRTLGACPVNIKMSRVGVNPLIDLVDTFLLFQTFRRLNPDIVLGSFVKPVIFGMLAAWMAGVPKRFAMIEGLGYFYTESGEDLNIKKRILTFIISKLYRLALKRTHGVIFLNLDDQLEFSRRGILNSERAYVLGGIGVDLDDWHFIPHVIEPIRFIFVGRLLREKGIHQFADAARIVKRKYKKAEFIVLGEIDKNPGSINEDQMNDWVEAGLLKWPGCVRVQPWLAISSVFVLPSYREGVPLSTQEAMATGLPIITTDVPGCRETVVDGVNGYLVPVRDAGSLAEAMIRFIERPGLIGSMGRESRRLAEERFDVNVVNTRLFEILGL
jgi:glycosyltransferase involved in cell wall biosynthesis